MQFLSIKQTCAKVGLSRAELDRKERAKTFPQRITIGFRKFYLLDEVEDWMEERVADRNNLIAPAVRELERGPSRS
jgi:predicted DNA-binding transcriptional regulator AlpA